MAIPGHPDPQQALILAALLAYPEPDAREVLRDLLPLAPWLADPLAELDQLPLDHWQGEHTRLFFSGYPRTPCPPFESVYRQGRMGGTVVAELAGFYRRAGLEARGVPADYLGTLLECLAILATGNDPAREGLGRELWNEHLSRWLPRFSRDLQDHGELQLYRVLGERLARLCCEDAGRDTDGGLNSRELGNLGDWGGVGRLAGPGNVGVPGDSVESGKSGDQGGEWCT
jgi:TorA maturation chaperone TorD